MTLDEVRQLRVGSKMKHKDGRICYLVLPTDYPFSIKEINGVQYVPLITTIGSGISSTKLSYIGTI